jgi:hypothetical protein
MNDPELPLAPPIDGRTAEDIVALLAGTAWLAAPQDGLLTVYTTSPGRSTRPYPFPPWREVDPASGAPLGRSAALIRLFARLCEILMERLNRVPEKNLLAFLDLLGAERQPPSPARVPLSFTLAAGSISDGEVPAGTRVAAPPPPGTNDPVEFETEEPLTVSAARLEMLMTWQPDTDKIGLWGTGESSLEMFTGNSENPHILYIGDGQLFAYAMITDLHLQIELVDGDPINHSLCWCDNTLRWQYLKAEDNESGQETWISIQPKEVKIDDQCQHVILDFSPGPSLQPGTVNGIHSRWLRCVKHAIPLAERTSLPKIKGLVAAVHLQRLAMTDGLPPDVALLNGVPLDVSQAFFPFGEQPKPYDTFYLACQEALASNPLTRQATSKEFFPGVSSHVEIWISLANGLPVGGQGHVRPSTDLELVWECWSGTQWQTVGQSRSPDWLPLIQLDSPWPLPEGKAPSSLTIQGSAESAVRLTARAWPKNAERANALLDSPAVEEIPIDRFGRFEKTWTTINSDLIELRAEDMDRAVCQTCWLLDSGSNSTLTAKLMETVSARETATKWKRKKLMIHWDQTKEPIDYEHLAISIPDNFKGDDLVVRVSHGNLLHSDGEVSEWQADRAKRALEIDVVPGPNNLLIQLIQPFSRQVNHNTRVAATTVRIDDPPTVPEPDRLEFVDGTYGLTQSGLVRLKPPQTAAATIINGQDRHWLRVRIVKGNYGKTASYVLKNPNKPEEGFLLIPQNFRPPIIQSIGIGYEHIHQRTPELCITYNQHTYADKSLEARDGGASFAPFVPMADDRPAMYLGLALPPGKASFPAKALSFYAQLGEPSTDPPEAGGRMTGGAGWPQVDWEYWNGDTWAGLGAQDRTAGFRQSGALTLLPPVDFAPTSLFGLHLWWLRASLRTHSSPPRIPLAWLRLNTISALQVVSIRQEILGSSKGIANQSFRSARAPVLPQQCLEVREPEIPGSQELNALRLEEGSDVVRIRPATAARPREVWVRWHEVPDLYGSGPGDRHYTINHLTGEIQFGNGVNGRIPPPGSSNLLLAFYRTGGGMAGNCAAGTVVQLKTTVPYVDKVSNPEPAMGGSDAESLAAMVARAPRQLRHQDRAVTVEDYEDLTLLASTEVARVRCVPLRNLKDNPLGERMAAGCVSVIVVPRADIPQPSPSQALLAHVHSYLAARSDGTAEVFVVAPLYLQVSVVVEVAVVTPTASAEVERGVRARLEAFLHPLTGGLDQRGWEFGRAPHRSDCFTIIEQVPGVDHCRHLELQESEVLQGVRSTDLFLVCSGQHEITLSFPGA